jgi:uncharacterized protein YerC
VAAPGAAPEGAVDVGVVTANDSAFNWSRRTERAALLVAQDEQTDTAIAASVGVSQVTIERWKRHPEFAGRVQEHRDLWREQIEAKGIADRQNRVDALNDRWHRMQQVIEERASDQTTAHVAGGSTGLIVRDVKGVGKGDDFQLIDIYSVDTGLLRELREHEKQAAQELGEWSEKREISGPGGDPIEVRARDYREGLAPFLPPADDDA